jgi:predicted dehydrogenase
MIRAAVVGTSFGARVHVPALRGAGFDVVALVGNDPERTKRRAERLEVPLGTISLDEAIATGIDAVSIASPPATHAAVARKALEHGCHVLCEKPFTRDTTEATALRELAESMDRVGLIGHEFRFAEDRSVAARALREGRIGEPTVVALVSFTSFLRTMRMPEWFYDPQRAGGWLGAAGSHVIDQVRTWLGEFEAVSAALPSLAGIGVEDGFDVRFRLRSGVEGTMVQTAASWGPPVSTTRVAGPAGTLWLSDGQVMVADEAHPDGTALEVPTDLALPEVDASGPFAGMTRMELPPYLRLAQTFRSAIEAKTLPNDPGPATFADGVACMKVMDAIRRSSVAGGAWMPASDSDVRHGGD